MNVFKRHPKIFLVLLDLVGGLIVYFIFLMGPTLQSTMGIIAIVIASLIVLAMVVTSLCVGMTLRSDEPNLIEENL